MNKPYSTGCTQICNQGRDCTCAKQCENAAPEGGNVWFVGPEPVELNVFQSVAAYLLIVFLSVISLGLAVGATEYFFQLYQRFFN